MRKLSPSPTGRGRRGAPGEGRMRDKSRFSSPEFESVPGTTARPDQGRTIDLGHPSRSPNTWLEVSPASSQSMTTSWISIATKCGSSWNSMAMCMKRRRKKRDEKRDKRLRELGYTILRIPNGLAINDPERLREMVQTLRPSPGAPRRPLPEGEGL